MQVDQVFIVAAASAVNNDEVGGDDLLLEFDELRRDDDDAGDTLLVLKSLGEMGTSMAVVVVKLGIGVYLLFSFILFVYLLLGDRDCLVRILLYPIDAELRLADSGVDVVPGTTVAGGGGRGSTRRLRQSRPGCSAARPVRRTGHRRRSRSASNVREAAGVDSARPEMDDAAGQPETEDEDGEEEEEQIEEPAERDPPNVVTF